MAWSPDGKLLATVCKDGKVRIYDPRKSPAPVQVRMMKLQSTEPWLVEYKWFEMAVTTAFRKKLTEQYHFYFLYLFPGGPRSRGPQGGSCCLGV